MKKKVLYCLLVFLPYYSMAMKPPYFSMTENDTTKAEKITEFPFTLLSGGVILIKAGLDNFKDSFLFVFDTGSGGISLDSSTREQLQWKVQTTNNIIRGIGGIKNVVYAFNHTLQLPELSISGMNFHINDYSLLSAVYGVKIDGIIGYSFFHRFIVTINYEERKVQVYSPGKFVYPKRGSILKPQFTTLIFQPLLVKEEKAIVSSFYFDTGAGLCLMFSKDFINEHNFFSENKKMFDTQVEGLGGKKEMQLTTFKLLKLGPYKFKNVPAYIFDDEYNLTAFPQNSGILGNDVLRRFTVILNYPKKEIWIKPNKYFREPFDYSYTGMSLYQINNDVIIGDIIKDSPADKAGLQVNDIVIGMNNKLYGTIQTYKPLLQATKQKIRLLVMRQGQPLLFTLRIESIR